MVHHQKQILKNSSAHFAGIYSNLKKTQLRGGHSACKGDYRTVPETYQVLRRVCAICDNRTDCARDFTRNPSGSEWKEYCTNTGTLVLLDALARASRAEL